MRNAGGGEGGNKWNHDPRELRGVRGVSGCSPAWCHPRVPPVSPPVWGLTERGDCLAGPRSQRGARDGRQLEQSLARTVSSVPAAQGGHRTLCGGLGAGPALALPWRGWGAGWDGMGWGGEGCTHGVGDAVGAAILLLLSC